jgi:hypothetical protein
MGVRPDRVAGVREHFERAICGGGTAVMISKLLRILAFADSLLSLALFLLAVGFVIGANLPI